MCRFKQNQKGVATIEFAILFLPFFFFIAAIVESLIFVYKIAVIDYITDNAAKENITLQDKYTINFNRQIKSKASELFIDLNEENSIITVEFCKNLNELRDDRCVGDEENFTIAKYKVKYDVNPIFLSLRHISGSEFIESIAVYPTEKDIK